MQGKRGNILFNAPHAMLNKQMAGYYELTFNFQV